MASASTLDQYAYNVQTYSAAGNYSHLNEYVNKSYDLLTRYANSGNLNTVLDTLSMQHHSIGILKILIVKYNTVVISDFEALFTLTQEFISQCNGEQVRYASDSFAELCHLLTNNLVNKKQSFRGIILLCKAIDKIQVKPTQLTSIHADLCQLCLLAKCMKPALNYLDIDINDVNKENGKYDPKFFLLYYYYGGMIYTAVKKYERALYFFEAAITTPSYAVSHIVLEAYKKYILVSLIYHGKIPSLPKYTPQVVIRYMKPLCNQYYELANCFTNNNPDELQATVARHAELYTRENNMGLVKQCVSSIYKKNIQRLTKTFLTLSLADMAERVKLSGPQEAEKYVLNMIEDGEIFASINQKDGMVRFHDSVEKYNCVPMLKNFDLEMKECIQLDFKLREMTRELANMQQKAEVSTASSSSSSSTNGTNSCAIPLKGHPKMREDDEFLRDVNDKSVKKDVESLKSSKVSDVASSMYS